MKEIRTLLGTFFIETGSKGICKVVLGRLAGSRPLKKRSRISFLVSPAAKKIDLRSGTPFQQKVWRAIQTIPYGETRSYSWVARKAGHPKAIRAVANACGANPLPILIPCHRVISKNGGLGGFSSPIGWKKRLLAHEGVII